MSRRIKDRALRFVYVRLPAPAQRAVWRTVQVVLGAGASFWRRRLDKTLFIGITGSLGKTTCKELLGGLLEAHGPTLKTIDNSNGVLGIPRTIFRIRSAHRYAVVEAGTASPGDLLWMSRVIRPRIAAILAVRREHYASFRTVSAVAVEKKSFLEGMQPGGIAWLNGDDPNVARMEAPPGVAIRRFGRSPEFELWADSVSSSWPGRLSFDVHFAGRTQPIAAKLVGVHWLPSVLAASGIALDCGMSLPQIAERLALLEPMTARLEPVQLSSGAVLLRDEIKSSESSVEAAFDVLRQARGVRRWLVFGGMDDTPRSQRERMIRVGRQIPEFAEGAVFLGTHAETAVQRAVKAGMPPGMAHHAPDLQSATRILRQHTGSGDLILLKGVRQAHLTRIYFALEEQRFGPVACWKPTCPIKTSCDTCNELHDSH